MHSHLSTVCDDGDDDMLFWNNRISSLEVCCLVSVNPLGIGSSLLDSSEQITIFKGVRNNLNTLIFTFIKANCVSWTPSLLHQQFTFI